MDIYPTKTTVPPFGYSTSDTIVGLVKHLNHSPGLLLLDALTHERVMRCTVYILDRPPEKGKVWIKTWSENEGIIPALELAGVITCTGAYAPCGFKDATGAELTSSFVASIPRKIRRELDLE